MYRVGIGYDVHALAEDRKLVLGGVVIPYERGLDGHSDADVLIHAVIDAILGAACQGDIGRWFPDSSEEYKNISSMELLRQVIERLVDIEIVNIDAVIVAQKPKLASHIDEMQENIIRLTGCEYVNIKATTTERLGFEGREEGISAQAACMMKVKKVHKPKKMGDIPR